MEMEELEKEVNNATPTQEKQENKQFTKSKSETFDGWREVNFDAVDPVTLPLNNTNKIYSVYVDFAKLPKEIADKVLSLLSLLNMEKYTCRIGYPSDSALAKDIAKIANFNKEVFLPFKKFNEEIYEVGSVPTTKLPFAISKFYASKGYNMLPGVVRAFRANAVNLVLGRTCLLPTNFMIVYTTCGTTEITAKTKLDNCKFTNCDYLVIKLCSVLKIPVLNLGSTTFGEDLRRALKQDKGDIEVKEPHTVPVEAPKQEEPKAAEQPAQQAQPVQAESKPKDDLGDIDLSEFEV